MHPYLYNNDTPSYFPHDYTPIETDILCGRGKIHFNHPGNIKFNEAILNNLQNYENACRRLEKSMVVNSVIDMLHDAGHRFIKYDKTKQQWFVLAGESVHGKVGHAIRDLLKTKESQASRRIKASQNKMGTQPQTSIITPPSSSSSEKQTLVDEGVITMFKLPDLATHDSITQSFACDQQDDFASWSIEPLRKSLGASLQFDLSSTEMGLLFDALQ